VIPCGMCVPVAVWQPCELLYTCYLLLGGLSLDLGLEIIALFYYCSVVSETFIAQDYFSAF